MNLLKKHPAQSIGVFITVCFLLTGIFRLEFLDKLELKFYDLKINLKSDPTPPEEIVIAGIDCRDCLLVSSDRHDRFFHLLGSAIDAMMAKRKTG